MGHLSPYRLATAVVLALGLLLTLPASAQDRAFHESNNTHLSTPEDVTPPFAYRGDAVFGDEHKVWASNGLEGHRLGTTLFLTDSLAIVGTPWAAVDGAIAAGSAYLYARTGDTDWEEIQVFELPEPALLDFYGYAVGIHEETILISAPNHDELRGEVHVYTRGNDGMWTYHQRLVQSDPAPRDFFGYMIDISGDRALISAGYSEVDYYDQGAAYIFDYVDGEWIETAKLVASDGAEDDMFGTKIALDGNTAFVGTYAHDIDGQNNRGAVWVFELVDGEWTETQKLTASDGLPNDRFGESIGLHGDHAIIGANGVDHDGQPMRGAAYAFERQEDGTWVETQKIIGSRDEPSSGADWFGQEAAIHGTTAIITANMFELDGQNEQGVAYVFEYVDGEWTEVQMIAASDGAAGARFGQRAALTENVAIVTAIFAEVNGVDGMGAAYFYHRAGAVSGEDEATPQRVALGQNYPNPVATTTAIDFSIASAEAVTLEVFDVTGRRVATLVDGPLTAGHHTVTWDVSGLASGVYIYRLSAGGDVQARQLSVIR